MVNSTQTKMIFAVVEKGKKMRIIDADALPYEKQVLSTDDEWCLKIADIEAMPTIEQPQWISCARPLEEWGEDYGDVLWWKFPIEEPPYVGSPLDLNWTGYHTHWTPIVVPQPPKGDE